MTKLTIGTWTVTFLVGKEPELFEKSNSIYIYSSWPCKNKLHYLRNHRPVLASKYLPVCWSSFWWVNGYETVVFLLLLHVEWAQLRDLRNLALIPPGLLPEVFQACPLGRRPHCRSRTRWRDYLFLTGECLGIPSKEPPRSRRQMDSHGGLKRRSRPICGTFYLN